MATERTWLHSSDPPRAAALIVTIYGDVVEPRGGQLWMGNLIEICRDLGISETLVRTAVSRLVAAGRLLGERDGRRSFYRLTTAARVEFLAAADRLFAPHSAPKAWLFIRNSSADTQEELLQQGFALIGDGLLVGADRPLPDRAGLIFRAETVQGFEDLPDFARRHWDIDAISAAYRAVIDRFQPVADSLHQGKRLSPRDSLVARVALVHDYRLVLLRDPCLPRDAMPARWAGDAARRLFASLYARLSPEADSQVGRQFVNAEGPLQAQTEATRFRLHQLQGSLKALQEVNFPLQGDDPATRHAKASQKS